MCLNNNQSERDTWNAVCFAYIFQVISKTENLEENLTISREKADIFAKKSVRKKFKIMFRFQRKAKKFGKIRNDGNDTQCLRLPCLLLSTTKPLNLDLQLPLHVLPNYFVFILKLEHNLLVFLGVFL